MPKKEYGWATGSPPEIAPHSLAKHRILRDYVQRYIEVLTARWGTQVFRVAIVDGFAGGGEYQDRHAVIHPGSPLILIDAVRAAEKAVNSSRSKPLRIDARYIFVEKEPPVVAYLKEVLRKRGDQPQDDGVIQILEGTFDSHLEGIISRIKSRGKAHRAIFVLDQYGYTEVPVAMLTRIFDQLPNAEVFLTLAVGWITAYLPNARIAAERLGLSQEMIARVNAIDEATFDISDPNRRPDLLTIQRILQHAFTVEAGSKFYTPFFIVSRESNRPYWFLHMANSARANDVVKELHWAVENHFQHFGRAGLTMLGYDPQEDPNVTGQSIFQFDDAARARTNNSLLEELPRRIASRHPGGISFGKLHEEVSNETPATLKLLADSVRDLCVGKELEKRGGEGERRAPTTSPHADDVISLPRQVLLKI